MIEAVKSAIMRGALEHKLHPPAASLFTFEVRATTPCRRGQSTTRPEIVRPHEPTDGVDQRRHQFGGERVESVGTVDGQRRDPVSDRNLLFRAHPDAAQGTRMTFP